MKKIERGTGSRCKIEKVGYWRAGKKFDQRDAFGKEQKKKKKKRRWHVLLVDRRVCGVPRRR